MTITFSIVGADGVVEYHDLPSELEARKLKDFLESDWLDYLEEMAANKQCSRRIWRRNQTALAKYKNKVPYILTMQTNPEVRR